tara:strand:- start:577 stop:684 length:108 start_codon:yes stop_codon:yes gene_type:complete
MLTWGHSDELEWNDDDDDDDVMLIQTTDQGIIYYD